YQELPVDLMRRNALDFYEEIRRRHTVRDFDTRPVPRDIIESCLLAAGTAPNGANHQPWHFAVIGNPDIKRQIRIAAEEEEQAFYAGR
ncbi:nitroreductase family protein, partial [Proteus mirabilis]|uniref:nitroreductase family protein n=2 Tax=Pseudomonadota TaxID=1224 RepID=UPI0025754D16